MPTSVVVSFGSLNRYLSWADVCGALRLDSEGPGLPVTCKCPLCRKPDSLHVTHDSTEGGYRATCSPCGFAGGLLDLVAAAWGLDIPKAAARLEARGLLPAGADPSRAAKHRDRELALGRLWDSSRTRMATDPGAGRELRAKFRLHAPTEAVRWRNGPGQLMGFATVAEIHQAVFPWAQAHQPPSYSPFRGHRGFRDAIVVAFRDAPGRISGLWCIGKSGGPGDRVFVPISRSLGNGPGIGVEAGLGGLESLALAGDDGAWAIAVRDPLLALRLQARHANVSARLLPIVSWYEGPKAKTLNCWPLLGDRRPVLWAPVLDGATVVQAMRSGGYVSKLGNADADPASLAASLHQMPPADVVRKLLRQAQTWSDALAKAVEDAGDDGLKIASGIVAFGGDIAQAADALPSSLRGRFLRAAGLCLPRERAAVCGKYLLVERDASWHWRQATARPGRTDSSQRARPLTRGTNFALRIEEATDTPDGVRYRIRMAIGRRTAEFLWTDSLSQPKKLPMALLRTVAVRAGILTVPTADTEVANRLLEAALAFAAASGPIRCRSTWDAAD